MAIPPKVTVADISQGGRSGAGNVVGLVWNTRACQYLGLGAKERCQEIEKEQPEGGGPEKRCAKDVR